MNKQLARTMFKTLKGTTFAGWQITKFINFGKSAVVMKAQKDNNFAAVKVFDPEVVEKSDKSVQRNRINRELKLKGLKHPNLIEIIDGGFDKPRKLFFIVMEYIDWQNLEEVLHDIPQAKGYERKLIKQLAEAAQFLDSNNLCHRDIKPANILINKSFDKVILLDFGVLRPYHDTSITGDSSGRPFLGTLQYAPPEFLLGMEKETPAGWRAITFYQLGAVLHDLIMRTPIFKSFEQPYGRLVEAVRAERPVINNSNVPQALVDLGTNCLVKNPETRIKIVSWQDFLREDSYSNIVELDDVRQRVASYRAAHEKTVSKLNNAAKQTLKQIADDLREKCRDICINDRDCFPPIVVSKAVVSNQNTSALNFDVLMKLNHVSKPNVSLALTFVLEWMDEEANAIKVQGLVSSTASDSTITILEPQKVLFSGVHSNDALCETLRQVLYNAMNRAISN